MQAAWKVTKKGYNFTIGDDIRTLTSPKTKWYQKLGAAAMIASNFVPGLGQAKWAIKGAKAGLKASKAVKTIRYARSLKVTKKIKVAAKSGWNSFKNSRTYKAINNERGSIRLGRGHAKAVLSKKSVLKNAQLPTSGKIRYIPPSSWSSSQSLPRVNGGYIDKFDNVWIKGPTKTKSQAFEWDVQLSKTGKNQLGHLSRDGSHLNVSLDGRITHK